jgi:hypothetical protein
VEKPLKENKWTNLITQLKAAHNQKNSKTDAEEKWKMWQTACGIPN